jgi:hypothetical protein
MIPEMTQLQSSDFLLPELNGIGDAVCEVLALGVEEDVLGESILARVDGLIKQGRVTSGDVVRLSLFTDAMRVAEGAIAADGRISDAEVNYALPLVQATARRMSAFRAYYAHMRDATRDHVREFIETHRPDRQLFGGACQSTRWLGLEIVRRVADETGDRGPLDRYAEIMLRLLEETIAIDGSSAPAERVRAELEERLGLRRLLAQAEAAAPEDSQDPRARAFCSVDAPEVFHAIAHANQIWRRDPLDVETVHQDTRSLFSRLLERAVEQTDAGTGRVLLVLGEAGSGKTHLMRAFRERVHSQRSGYVGYMQMSAAPDDYARYVLIHLIESLEKPYDEPGVQDSGLMCFSDALLMAPLSISPEERQRLRDAELSQEELCSLVFELADDVVRDPRFTDVDLDLVRALLFLQRREPPLYKRVVKYLRCEPLGKRDLSMLGDLAPRTGSDDALRMTGQLGKLIARVEGGALVLLLDQLEDIYKQDGATDRFRRCMDVVRHVSDQVPNALVVITCLRDIYKDLKVHLTKSVLDRIERDPEPQHLLVGRSLVEIEAMVERRLAHLFESQGVRHRAEQPHFPYPRTLLESLATLGARDVFANLHAYQARCIAQGALIGAADAALITPVESVAPPPPSLTLLWTEFQAGHAPSAQVPDDDDALLELLRSTLRASTDELPPGSSLAIERGPGGLTVALPDRGEEPRTALVQITNKTPRGGALTKQLEALIRAAGKRCTPVAVRSSDFGGGAGSTLAKQLGALAKAQGRRLVVDDGTWRMFLAYQAFHARYRDSAEFKAWAQDTRPLLDLEVMRALLGLPSVASGVAPFPHHLDEVRTVPPAKATKSVRPEPPLQTVAPLLVQPPDSHNGPLHLGVTISVNAKPAELDPQQLKRHAAFLGSSGSGKTSLALNVIEQLVARGVGAILLDRKGDLAVYADPAAQQRLEVDNMRARRRRELFEQAHVRLFTPGNPMGRSLRIRAVPEGLEALPPHERAQIAQFAAQGLGAMMGYKGTGAELTYLAILSKAIEVLGQLRGTGEVQLRQLIDLLAEEDESLVAEIGHLDPKLFKKLVTHLETLRLNHGALLESRDEPLRAEVLLGRDGSVPEGKVPITIISTKFLGDVERVDFWVSQLLVELSRWCSRSPSAQLQSVLFLDEADAYLPATSKPATKEPLMDLLKRARSAGLGVMLATQNPGDLDYKARDTITTWWLGRISSKTAIEKMRPLLSECRTDVSSALATASVGEFFQVADGHALRMRTERSLVDTVQLAEERILQLAQPGDRKAAQG